MWSDESKEVWVSAGGARVPRRMGELFGVCSFSLGLAKPLVFRHECGNLKNSGLSSRRGEWRVQKTRAIKQNSGMAYTGHGDVAASRRGRMSNNQDT
jgi:hypothetical protein